MKIFINPGHSPGGIPDPGAGNKITGDTESDIAYKAGVRLKHYMTCAGYDCALLQSDDLGEVCAASNTFDADMFISLHCNAFNGAAQGTEVLYKSEKGAVFAQCIQNQIIESLPLVDRGVKQRDNLHVLNGTNATAVLVEMAFIDNMDDLSILTTKLDDVVRAVARGITDYIGR